MNALPNNLDRTVDCSLNRRKNVLNIFQNPSATILSWTRVGDSLSCIL